MIQTLDQMQPGFEGVIESLEGHPVVVERLQEIGFVPGEKLRLNSRLIFGEPYVVEVRGIQVALRRDEILCIQMKSPGSEIVA